MTEYVVLTNDPAVPLCAADFWEYSYPHYRAVTAFIERLAEADADADAAYRALACEPVTGRFEAPLTRALAGALADHGADIPAIERTLARADESVYIRYHLGAAYDPLAAPFPLDEAASLPRLRDRPPPRAGGSEVLVVIPLRDRVGGDRVRNLLACVASLRDQSADPGLMTVTVLEADTEPRWRHLVEPVADRYIFGAHDGAFNRSWAANAGVMHSATEAPYVCVLDADILVDHRFIERNLDRMRRGTYDAHLPFVTFVQMDAPASNLAIRRRCVHGDPDVPMAHLRALLLRDVPGACLWARREFYERLGGHDERYEGWGGEDDDLLARMQLAGTVQRFDDQFLHMAHPRPSMAGPDGRPYNTDIPPLSWTPAHGFGELTGPRAAEGRA